MEHKHPNIHIQELKAETVASLQDLQNFVVEMKGIFYRNYSPDLLSNPNSKDVIELSRDSVFHLLPEGLFFEKGSKKFQEKKEKARALFQFFDTEYFALSLKLEKEINRICKKSQFGLADFLCRDTVSKAEADMLSLVSMSGFVNAIRGNEGLIIDILKEVLNVSKIELIKHTCSTSCPSIQKTFIIHIANLSAEQYQQENQPIYKVFEVVKDYLLPFEIQYHFKIKDRKQDFKLGKKLILGYNINT